MNTLRATRRSCGLTQASVAASAGISLPTLRALERGEGGVRALAAVMAVLDLRWGWAPDRVQAARALADRRRARGLSQAQLADRIGVSRPVVIALERDLGATVATLVRAAAVLGVRSVLRAAPSGRGGLVPATNAPAQDLVMTPPELATAVIGHFAGRMTGMVLDPSRGQGAFYDRFPHHLARDWCEITENRDFLDWQDPVDWVMTNPPWSRLRDFSRHAMRIAPNIVWLAPLTGLDMVAVGWRPTVFNYLGRVTKPRILEAVREGAGERAAELIGHLKKGDMAKEAERLLADTGWLPEPLRLLDDGTEADLAAADDGGSADLPDFLTAEDGEDEAAEDEEPQQVIAAE